MKTPLSLLLCSLLPALQAGPGFRMNQQGVVSTAAAEEPIPITTGLVSDYNPGILSGSVGDSVSALPDSIGGFDLGQGTVSKRPTIQTGPAGLKCVRFDGIDDFLERTASVPTLSSRTIYVVAKWGTGTRWLFSYSQSAAARDTGLNIVSATTARMAAYHDPMFPSANATVAASTWTLLTGAHNNGGSASIWVNAGSATTASATTSPTFNRINLGIIVWLYGTEYPLNGDIARVLVYDTKHDSTQQAEMAAWINRRYALW